MVGVRYSGDEQSQRLALVFPGRGYSLDMPLLWYSQKVLVELGWQVWGIDYDFRKPSSDDLERMEQTVAWVLQQPRVAEALLNSPRGLVVYGTQDPAIDMGICHKIASKHTVLEFAQADHSLEVSDAVASSQILTQYVSSLKSFLLGFQGGT